MVAGGAGDLAPLLAELSGAHVAKYLKDEAEFNAIDVDELDPRNCDAALWHWIGRVWIHENPLPEGEALSQFDGSSLDTEFREYTKRRGMDYLGRGGLSLEECWATGQLRCSEPSVLFVEKHYAAGLPSHVARIELHSEQLVWLLADFCFRLNLSRPTFPVLVSDGSAGHTIAMAGLSGIGYRHPRGFTVRPNWFVFTDPWPARSLLAFEQNYAGAKAIEDISRPPAWVIAPEDLNRVIVGFVLTYRQVELMSDSLRSMETVSSYPQNRPLWSTFGLMIRLHNGYQGPISRLGAQGINHYETLRHKFNLPPADLCEKGSWPK